MPHRVPILLAAVLLVAGAMPAQTLWTVSHPERTAGYLERLGFEREGDVLSLAGAAVRLRKGRAPDRYLRPALGLAVEDPDVRADELHRRGLRVHRIGPGEHRLAVPGGHDIVIARAETLGRPGVPREGALNPFVLAVLETYPADGTHRYHWPRSGGWRGNIRDLRYGGELLCKGDEQGRAYCCGLTFEVFLQAWGAWCAYRARPFRIKELKLAGVRRLQGQWFGSAEDRSCLRTALVANGLGRRIAKLETARPGDFVQLWRHSGSGHSVIFMGWERKGGRIVGLRYWSTQKSTRGIGERREFFGEDGSAVKRDEFFLCRVGIAR